jgi:hypothetical protein
MDFFSAIEGRIEYLKVNNTTFEFILRPSNCSTLFQDVKRQQTRTTVALVDATLSPQTQGHLTLPL